MSFVHLHVHSEYSLLDGFSNLKKLVKRTHEMGMPAIALTDHGTMFGAIEFYKAAKDAGVKPIIGLEAYMASRGMGDRDSKLDKQSSHLLLLAENEVGYRNLLEIASAAQLKGFYYFPRVDHDFLAAHAEGLIATSGCMAAEIPRTIMREGPDAARAKLDWYYNVFGADNFFIELQQHDIKELPALNKSLVDLGLRYQARYVATNDVHYVNQSDSRLQDILLSIQTGSVLSDPNRFRMSDSSYYLRSPAEMATLFAEVPEALSNTVLIADRCNLNLDPKGYHLPLFPVPEGFTAQTYLRKLCEEGLHQYYGAREHDPKVRERLEYELQVIHEMGFDAYFLIVWDLCRHARQEGVWYNARGSAAGSMVAYTLDITLVEPINHGLIFERFLNPGRISMPDIDLDFQDDLRPRMLEYCAHKYGDDKVAQIVTFGTLGARAALRDVGRVMDIPIPEVDRVAKLIPNVPGKTVTIADALEEVPELKQAYNESDTLRSLIDTASQMEGVVRHAGTHAAGLVIADKPIVEYLPLHRPTSGSEDSPIKAVTQFEMAILDNQGMLKVDFLGLATLTVMARACQLIKERHGIDYNLHNIPVDDDETYKFIGEGHTAGIFQLEGNGMTRYITQMKPQNLGNVIAMVALYRPGPLDFIPTYIKRMHGDEKVSYRHPALEPIFKETYGIPIYQEQIMFAAMDIAGYTASEADDLRKAISKKKADAIAKHRLRFIDGAIKGGMPETSAKEIFEDWENFARYGFNKSHAADYGVIAVQTGFLKAHYTVEYMAALLSASKNEAEKVAMYVADCRGMGITVLPPDVNVSGWDFTIEDRPEGAAIRFGLGAVKNVGQAPVEMFLEARKDGLFTNLSDLVRRLDLRQVGKRALECLVKVGALDRFGNRAALLESLDRLISVSSSHFKALQSNQLSFFGEVAGMDEDIRLPPGGVIDPREQLNWERELIGLYISDNPLSPYLPGFKAKVTHQSTELADVGPKDKVVVGGIVTRLRTIQTKDGKVMGFATIDDLAGSIELVVFPRTWEQCSSLLEVDRVLLVDGKVDNQRGDPKILVDRIIPAPVIAAAADEPAAVPTAEPAVEAALALVSAAPVREPARQPVGELDFDEPGSDDFDGPPPPEFDDWGADFQAPPRSEPPAGRPVVRPAPLVPPARVSAAPPAPAPEVEPPARLVAEAVSMPEQDPAMSLPPFIVSPTPAQPSAHNSKLGSSDNPRMLTIVLRATGDKDMDVRRLKCINGALRSSPGRDKFAFHILENGRRYLLEFPNESTGISSELMTKLVKFVEEENIRVDPLIIQ